MVEPGRRRHRRVGAIPGAVDRLAVVQAPRRDRPGHALPAAAGDLGQLPRRLRHQPLHRRAPQLDRCGAVRHAAGSERRERRRLRRRTARLPRPARAARRGARHRDVPAGQPDQPPLRPVAPRRLVRYVARPRHPLPDVRPAARHLDDERILSPDSLGARAGGTDRRRDRLPGVLQGDRPACSAGCVHDRHPHLLLLLERLPVRDRAHLDGPLAHRAGSTRLLHWCLTIPVAGHGDRRRIGGGHDSGRRPGAALPASDRRGADRGRGEGLMAEISLRRIVKRYGVGEPAVNDVSLDVADGELLILVGPSGCGKSTVLRMIAGLEDVTSGDLLIGGRRVNDVPPRDRNLAMVFQNYALYPHLTVFENIAFPLRVRGGTSAAEVKQRVEDAAALLELTEHLRRRPSQLSGGQRQRVAMGRAIVRHADAFLFDEPLSNLDAKLRGQMRLELLRLQRRLGTTTVYVTHDQTEAMTLGDRVALLRRGVLQQVGPPRTLYDEPANLFVAGFIGSPPMNLVAAALEDGRLRLPFVTVELPPALRAAVGTRPLLIVGLRAEAFEDPAQADESMGGATFQARVDVVEWLGNEQYAYVPYDATSVGARLAELAREMDAERPRSQLVVAVDPRRRLERGATLPLRVDPRRMHLFDPESGAALTRGAKPAG